jgi:hypothetical protein
VLKLHHHHHHQEQAHPTRLPRRMTSMRVPASFHSATLSSIMSLVTWTSMLT